MRDTLVYFAEGEELWIVEYYADIDFVRAEKNEPNPKWRAIVRFNTTTKLWEPWAMPFEQALQFLQRSQDTSKHEWRLRNIDGDVIPGAALV